MEFINECQARNTGCMNIIYFFVVINKLIKKTKSTPENNNLFLEHFMPKNKLSLLREIG